MSREYFQPDDLIKALQLKKDHNEASLLAGGTDLVVAMRNGRGPKGSIIDLTRVPELKGITAEGDIIRIGPMTTFTEIADSALLRNAAGALCTAAESVGSPQIRNRGTIGGNICNASAAADGLTPLLCLDAKIELQSFGAGETVNARVLPLEDFLIDSKKTAIKENEIMTGIFFKYSSADARSSFQKIGRRNALAIARLNGCCILSMNSDKVESIRFALGAATSKPERIRDVELLLSGQELNAENLRKAGKQAADYVLQRTGVRESSGYKLPVIEKFTAALIKAALGMEE